MSNQDATPRSHLKYWSSFWNVHIRKDKNSHLRSKYASVPIVVCEPFWFYIEYSCLFKGMVVVENRSWKLEVNILNGWQRCLHSTSDHCSLLAGSAQLVHLLGCLNKSHFIPDNIQIFYFKIPCNILLWKNVFCSRS